MERARDTALAPYLARDAARRLADRYLPYVGDYLEELADPQTGMEPRRLFRTSPVSREAPPEIATNPISPARQAAARRG